MTKMPITRRIKTSGSLPWMRARCKRQPGPDTQGDTGGPVRGHRAMQVDGQDDERDHARNRGNERVRRQCTRRSGSTLIAGGSHTEM